MAGQMLNQLLRMPSLDKDVAEGAKGRAEASRKQMHRIVNSEAEITNAGRQMKAGEEEVEVQRDALGAAANPSNRRVLNTMISYLLAQ
mmetsp:Transcript_24379/g.38335  ORF Transcript_24379/g.38335 Transcript_24379/m.38335 type:complete len:88 (-) Transcript_24379:194-457(-)|eukprot:CAMPEP_0184318828 /NCGR_PEP_ID=MMETSP1049-20130417/105065_1 /TAXON_ID=77928 /ORGANISM="Proteomonas sulcata, Strain CCMP704" /LENGTH=87 /DNA_ID=CAMNT_0026638747 /DNA_START=72 /DNA_END=335 /DNA_ORIENTATION=-